MFPVFPDPAPCARRTCGRRVLLAAALFVFTWAAPVRADELVLVNGDTLQGTLVREEAEAWIWQSPLLGEVRVPWDAILELRPEIPPGEPADAAPKLATDVSTLTTNRLVSADVLTSTDSPDGANPFPPRLTLSNVTLDFTGKDSAGNDDQTRLTFDLNSKFRHLRHRHFVQAEYDMEDRDEVRTTDERALGYKYNYFIGGPWLAYLSALSEEDQLSDLQQRLTGSAGPGYEFYDTPSLRWAVETGIAFNREDFQQDVDRNFWGLHYGLDWRWLMAATGLELFHNHALMQSFDQGSDWEIDTETGLRIHLIGRLKAVLKLKYDYDHLPAKDKDRMDRTWLFGAGFGL